MTHDFKAALSEIKNTNDSFHAWMLFKLHSETILRALRIADRLMEETSGKMDDKGLETLFSFGIDIEDRKLTENVFYEMRDQMLRDLQLTKTD